MRRSRLTLPPSKRTLVTARLSPQAVRTRGGVTVTGQGWDATSDKGVHSYLRDLLICGNKFDDATVNNVRAV